MSYVELQVEQWQVGPIKLLSGRWLVVCESAVRFVLHEVGSNVEPRWQVIWEHEEPVESWDTCSVMPEQGQYLVYVLLSYEDPGIPFWRLSLELRMSDKSDQLYDLTVLDIPRHELDLEVELQSGSSQFLYIPGENLNAHIL
ncbi:hypothetical protein EV363DRAFT_1458358 [Boletus edulis]|nr:hypothetical protein EV363DRAFT_1458358 [Boletus edulis]